MHALSEKYDKFCAFMENNTKGVELSIYSVAGGLLAISYLKIRPFTKFGRSNDIPRSFIKKRVLQNGSVQSIAPDQQTGALLLIDHKPPINLFIGSSKTLPVKIFGISVNSNGYSWLQSVTLHERIQFMPISKSNVNYAECQVALLQSNKTNIDLAEALISLGFARHDKSAAADTKDAQLAKYLKGLERTQAKATRKPFPWPIGKLESLLTQLIYDKVLPRKYSLPKLVR